MTSVDPALLNYISSLSANFEESVFKLPWKNSYLIKNFNKSDGNLVNLKDSKISRPWLLLEASSFTFKDNSYVKYICECNKVLKDMKKEQDPLKLWSVLCFHAKALEHIISTENEGHEFPPEKHPNDLKVLMTKKEPKKASLNQTVIAVLQDNNISTLYTLGRRSRPRCSKCSSEGCKCLQYYDKYVKDTSINSDTSSSSKDETSSTVSDENIAHHYTDRDANYGYNFTDIKYPLHIRK